MEKEAFVALYKRTKNYFSSADLNRLAMAPKDIGRANYQALFLTKPYKAGIGMLINVVNALDPINADAIEAAKAKNPNVKFVTDLPPETFAGLSLLTLIDFVETHGTATEKDEVKERISGQVKNDTTDLQGIYTELLLYKILHERFGSAELGDPDRADIVWTYQGSIYNIECKSLENGFSRYGPLTRPYVFYDDLVKRVENDRLLTSQIAGHWGVYALDTRKIADNPKIGDAWIETLLADAQGKPLLNTLGLSKICSVNTLDVDQQATILIKSLDQFIKETVDRKTMVFANLVGSHVPERGIWNFLFFLELDLHSMASRAKLQFDCAMEQNKKREHRIVFLRLEGLLGPKVSWSDMPPDMTYLMKDEPDDKIRDTAYELVIRSIKSSPHWMDCEAVVVNIAGSSGTELTQTLADGQSRIFFGPSATEFSPPEVFRSCFGGKSVAGSST